MRNEEIRIALFQHNIKQWEVAEQLGVSEITICRWLRSELPDDKKTRIMSAINKLAEEKKSGEW